MTKIYEALEQAGQTKSKQPADTILGGEDDRGRPVNQEVIKRQGVFSRSSTQRISHQLERSLDSLYQNVKALLPDARCRMIQLTSTRMGEDTAFYAQEFAKLCAWKYNKTTLFIRYDQRTGSRLDLHGLYGEGGSQENVSRDASSVLSRLISQVESSPLYVLSLTDVGLINKLESGSDEINLFFGSLEEKFDFVLVSSPVDQESADFVLLSKHIGGVILVVEAEKTRWQVVERLKKKVIDQGGQVLGVLLSKRKMYIPKTIYNLL